MGRIQSIQLLICTHLACTACSCRRVQAFPLLHMVAVGAVAEMEEDTTAVRVVMEKEATWEEAAAAMVAASVAAFQRKQPSMAGEPSVGPHCWQFARYLAAPGW